ncbi:MAG: hypothetical protein IPM54_39505 [Polyangiaceae bacterium]|nr:hypothetical protein [Polyangiaceae bacterium]
MRWIRLVFVGAATLGFAGLEGCGGKVVIDAEGAGGLGGAGGAGNSSTGGAGNTTTTTSSSSSGNSCAEGTCSGTPDGSCDCSGSCGGQDVKVTCFASGGSFTCTCMLSGSVVAKCEGAMGTFACDVKAGCCAPFFP